MICDVMYVWIPYHSAGYGYDPVDVKIAVKKLLVRRLREMILRTGKRSDGRTVEEVVWHRNCLLTTVLQVTMLYYLLFIGASYILRVFASSHGSWIGSVHSWRDASSGHCHLGLQGSILPKNTQCLG